MMARPARHLFASAVVLGVALAAVAQDAAAPASTGEATDAKREHAVSPRVSALIRATIPKYDPANSGKSAGSAGGTIERDKPANGIVRLPDYIVRERKLPTAEQVMSRKGLEQYAMNKYLGPADGFDRGFLNAITIPEIARKIPVLGFLLSMIPSMTNEERAMMYYYEDKRLQEMRDLMELSSFPSKTGEAGNDKLKREVQKTFMHPSELGR